MTDDACPRCRRPKATATEYGSLYVAGLPSPPPPEVCWRDIDSTVSWFQGRAERACLDIYRARQAREHARRDLHLARIGIVEETEGSVTGRLGSFTFAQPNPSGSYWRARGDVPLAVAEEIYADPLGRADVRAGGHCAAPPPREQAEWRNPQSGRRLWPSDQEAECRRLVAKDLIQASALDDVEFVPEPAAVGAGFVTQYDIDSVAGLRFFADTLRAHGLAGAERDPAGFVAIRCACGTSARLPEDALVILFSGQWEYTAERGVRCPKCAGTT